jgi:hypothetical protein
MVSGVAVFDFDNDGLLDVYAVNGASLPSLDKSDPVYHNRLFRNLGNHAFQDVTQRAGVQGRGYNIGVAIGDYDNDGLPDIFVAGLRENILYRNLGDGRFADETANAGLNRPDPEYGSLWAVSAAWLDYDLDGWLDLFVSNYCVWDPDTEPVCLVNDIPDYCHPKYYKPLPNSLFRNNRDGTFTDVSTSSRIRKALGKGMGVAVADFDDDGRPDVFVANDTLPNSYFRNQGDGSFREMAVDAFVAYTDSGNAVSGMGADARDVDNDGRPDIFETALTGETLPLYRNLGKHLFEERTFTSGLAASSMKKSGWSNGIVDLNNDGWKDLFAACGDVMDAEGHYRSRVPQSNAVFANLGKGRFAEVGAAAGGDFSKAAVHRGCAFGDLDNDGRVDVLTTALNGPLVLWRNTSDSPNHWLRVRTEGVKSNRDGMGAKIRLVTASGVQFNHVSTAVGYGCASDRQVHFGLGRDELVQELRIVWPSGQVQTLRDIRADQTLTVRETDR